MPSKILIYLIKHASIGISLSATAVLGFAYLIMLPTEQGSVLVKFISASQQLLQLSHLFFPLVVLIGLAFGLGLLHNHSEVVLMLQLKPARIAIACLVAFFMFTTVVSERLLWPSLMTQKEDISNGTWVQKGDTYIFPEQQAVKVQNGKIIDYSHKLIKETSPLRLTLLQTEAITPDNGHWLIMPNNTKAKYEWWQQWYQSVWPVPLFWWLWQLLNHSFRGSNATSITGSVAGLTITCGLLAEACHIVLRKALMAPVLTLAIPLATISLFIFFMARRRIA